LPSGLFEQAKCRFLRRHPVPSIDDPAKMRGRRVLEYAGKRRDTPPRPSGCLEGRNWKKHKKDGARQNLVMPADDKKVSVNLCDPPMPWSLIVPCPPVTFPFLHFTPVFPLFSIYGI
jgi:hypothetical protein